jgi:ADP-heptose:LPS heptosyltransferase
VKIFRLLAQFFCIRVSTLAAIFWRAHVTRPTISGTARKGPVSIIVFRLDAMGDVVMTTPLFRALKMAHPRSRCTVVVQKPYKSLLATNPHLDEILTLPNIRPAWLPQALRRSLAAVVFYWTALRRRHFDFAISPRWDVDEHLATFLSAMTSAATRVGYSEKTTPAKRQMNRGFDRAYDTCLQAGCARHEVLRNLAIAEALGATACESRPEIQVTEQDRKRAARLLAKVPASARLVALGIGAQSPGRRWPLEQYAGTIKQLDRAQRVWPVIVCSESEFGEALSLAALLPRPPVIVSGARLRDVCAVLERCELFIGNDSGCAHLAAAMGCKTLVISRHPRNGDPDHFNSPVRFAPCGPDVRVLQPAAGRDACALACISTTPHCILQIAVGEVVAAAQRMLNASPSTAAEEWPAKRRLAITPELLHSHSVDALQAAIQALQAPAARPLA